VDKSIRSPHRKDGPVKSDQLKGSQVTKNARHSWREGVHALSLISMSIHGKLFLRLEHVALLAQV
jgi:hypothetical protein